MKKLVKDKEVSEDEAKRASDAIQKLTDKYSGDIDSMGAAKEAEVMEV
jgi:ribosome recycling factor